MFKQWFIHFLPGIHYISQFRRPSNWRIVNQHETKTRTAKKKRIFFAEKSNPWTATDEKPMGFDLILIWIGTFSDQQYFDFRLRNCPECKQNPGSSKHNSAFPQAVHVHYWPIRSDPIRNQSGKWATDNESSQDPNWDRDRERSLPTMPHKWSGHQKFYLYSNLVRSCLFVLLFCSANTTEPRRTIMSPILSTDFSMPSIQKS